ncbi:MAG: DUF4446 family protein [Magnetococcus sp. WYHC-3]
MNFELNVVFYILITVVLILLIWVVLLEFKIKKLLRGKGNISLEDALNNLNKDVENYFQFREGLEKYLASVEHRLRKSVQSVETIRFDALKGTGEGGRQSFATALLSEQGDGVVLSSVYTRGHTGVYAKPIETFASKFELSTEEKEALTKAKKTCRL